VPVGSDELVLLVPPSHELASRRQVTMADIAHEPVVAHNDPSPARERVLRLFEEHRVPLHMVIALPSLDGIKRAVELKLGGAPDCRGDVRLPRLPADGSSPCWSRRVSRKRQVMLVCRKPIARTRRTRFSPWRRDKRRPEQLGNRNRESRNR
jgi:DNA-binding transcriptional LysR family regulator